MKLAIHIKKLFIIPACMLVAVLIFVSMSLADAGMPALSYATFAMTIGSFVTITTVYLYEREMSRYGFLIFLFLMVLVSSTMINTNDMKGAVYAAIETATMFIFMRYYKDNMRTVVIGCTIGLSICVYANFAHVLTHPALWSIEGEKDNVGYLLGNNYNQMGNRLLTALIFCLLCLKYSKWWLLNAIPLAVCSIIPLFLIQSMTSLTCIILFLLFCLVPSKRLQRFGCYSLLSVVILFQIFVVFSGKGLENNELAVTFVEEVLGKDITFTNRTTMWDQALKIIGDSPIIGHGMVQSEWFTKNMESSAVGPHNMVLAVLINGGVILLGLYLTICYVSLKKVARADDHLGLVLFFGVIVLMVIMLMEMIPYFFILILLGLSYYYDDICRQADEPQKEQKKEECLEAPTEK